MGHRCAPSAQTPRSSSSALWWLTVAICLCLFVPGCGGCWQQDPLQQAKDKKKKEDEEKKKKSEKPKPDFEAQDIVFEPGEGKSTSNVVKPGHWTTASKVFKANNGDLPSAEFYSAPVDSTGKPLEADHTPFRLVLTRPASLSKGQAKHFEFLYYIPRRFEGQSTAVGIQNKLYARGGGREIYNPGNDPTTRMPAHQFHLLVLATDPDRYGYIKRLESINPIDDSLSESTPTQYYRVSLPKLEKRVPLPTHPLAWTTIAYIFWDGIDPGSLTPDQQAGLIDWLHWGGQLVISGPDSLDSLRGSFLGEFLPAEKVTTKELAQSNFNELNDYWSLIDKKNVRRTLDVVADKPPVGVELKLTNDGTFVPHTGVLVAEGRVGRGRIAVTAFSLTTRSVVNWASLDNFYNNVLFRRPNRVFTAAEFGAADVNWVENKALKSDPRLVSTLRYFSRDIGAMTDRAAPTGMNETNLNPADPTLNGAPYGEFNPDGTRRTSMQVPSSVLHPADNDWHFDGYAYDNQSGVAGWNDFCAAAESARLSLREAAGVSIPKAGFVLRIVAVYLLFLVPINWAVFRMLGRVEWAWIAAPVIAIIGAGAVVRMAQLDIGFARSQTELNIVEAYGNHSRAHVTRYTALYSSLSTSYDFHFDDPSALAQPFPTKKREPQNAFNRVQPTTCYFRRDNGVSLNGFVVRSNTTDFVHSEQMLPLGGAFQLQGDATAGWQVNNQTDFPWQDATVLRCINKGEYEVAYIGELATKTAKPLSFVTLSGKSLPKEWANSPVMSQATSTDGQLSLWRIVELATRQLRLDPGDVRLLGWTEEAIPGLTITPQAPQTKSRTLAIVHLREASLPPLLSDKNMRISVVDEEEKKEEEQPSEPKPTAEAPNS